ncbi:MAG: N-acetylmuramoyl-L-alanine amidase, partial [Candidatus Omnitrophica bacterium]|nr:N-acetylmuramoyl-L-alanine amidase [Candidatus Omnitrophota bacterium]
TRLANFMKNKRLLFCIFIIFFITGCASVPRREALPTYRIRGVSYLSLVDLCNQFGLKCEYDTISRRIVLSKGRHKINLMIGEKLVIVDGASQRIKYPVDTYQGAVVVPLIFKQQIIDSLFKVAASAEDAGFASTQVQKVVIDPGHGGKDPGAIGRISEIKEKEINLDIAKRLSKLLKSEGIEVVMTRSSDKFVPLADRVAIANESAADLFISIHSNANHVAKLNGFEVYYVSPDVGDAKRAHQAVEKAVLDLEMSSFASDSADLKAILWDMVFTSCRGESIELAHSICRVTKKNLGVKILGIKEARFQVLKGVRMPAVLIETGFLSNSEEERKLQNSYYRQKIAESIKEGVWEYARDTLIMEAARR